MMLRVRRSRGQALIEFGILITVVAIALMAMFGFIRKAISHKMKSGADGVGQGMLFDG